MCTVSAAAVVVFLSVLSCEATIVPASTPSTTTAAASNSAVPSFVSGAGYDGLHKIGELLRSKIPMYTFGLSPAPTLETVMTDALGDSPISTPDDCFKPGTQSSVCQFIQGIIITFLVPIIVSCGGCTFLTCFAFWGHFGPQCGCCKCCQPQKKRTWLLKEKLIPLVACIGLCLLLFAFSSIGFSAASRISIDIDQVADSLVGVTGAVSTMALGIDSSIFAAADSMTQAVAKSLADLQQPLSAVQSAQSMLAPQLLSISSLFQNISQTPGVPANGCSTCTSRMYACGSASSGAQNINLPPINFTFPPATVRAKMDEGLGPISAALNAVPTQMAGFDSDVRSNRNSITDKERIIKIIIMLFFGLNWVVVVGVGVAFLARFVPVWWIAYFTCVLCGAAMWIFFGIYYPTSKILGETCELLPHPGGTKNDFLTSLPRLNNTPNLSGFINECVLISNGSIIKAFGQNENQFADATKDFTLAKQFDSSGLVSFNVSDVVQLLDLCTANIQTLTGPSLVPSYSTLTVQAQANIDQNIGLLKSQDQSVQTQRNNLLAAATNVRSSVPTVSSDLVNTISAITQAFFNSLTCGPLGASVVNVRGVLCDGVLRDIDAVWVCVMVLAILLQYLPNCVTKGKERFLRRKRSDKDPPKNEEGPRPEGVELSDVDVGVPVAHAPPHDANPSAPLLQHHQTQHTEPINYPSAPAGPLPSAGYLPPGPSPTSHGFTPYAPAEVSPYAPMQVPMFSSAQVSAYSPQHVYPESGNEHPSAPLLPINQEYHQDMAPPPPPSHTEEQEVEMMVC